MKTTAARFVLVLIIVQLNFSCSRYNNDNNSSSRVIKYEITGDLPTGKIALYTSATGSTFAIHLQPCARQRKSFMPPMLQQPLLPYPEMEDFLPRQLREWQREGGCYFNYKSDS